MAPRFPAPRWCAVEETQKAAARQCNVANVLDHCAELGGAELAKGI